jgi:hypothetical protein
MPDDVATDRERREELDYVVALKVQYGCRVESQSEFQAILVRGNRPNHILHFLLGFVTFFIWWLVVWLPLCIRGGETRYVLTVDEHGDVHERKS